VDTFSQLIALYERDKASNKNNGTDVEEEENTKEGDESSYFDDSDSEDTESVSPIGALACYGDSDGEEDDDHQRRSDSAQDHQDRPSGAEQKSAGANDSSAPAEQHKRRHQSLGRGSGDALSALQLDLPDLPSVKRKAEEVVDLLAGSRSRRSSDGDSNTAAALGSPGKKSKNSKHSKKKKKKKDAKKLHISVSPQPKHVSDPEDPARAETRIEVTESMQAVLASVSSPLAKRKFISKSNSPLCTRPDKEEVDEEREDSKRLRT